MDSREVDSEEVIFKVRPKGRVRVSWGKWSQSHACKKEEEAVAIW